MKVSCDAVVLQEFLREWFNAVSSAFSVPSLYSCQKIHVICTHAFSV